MSVNAGNATFGHHARSALKRRLATWSKPRRASLVFIVLLSGFVVVLLHGLYSTDNLSSSTKLALSSNQVVVQEAPPSAPAIIAKTTNATLGFEKILVLSTGPSWRTRGLDAAAKLTGLEFTIPTLPSIPDQLVHEFQQRGGGGGNGTSQAVVVPPFGSAKAWLAHLHMLEHFAGSGLATALIVEDDLDWDVRLRTEQMPRITDHIRNYTGLGPDDASTASPYGGDDAWDVLWLGHCGAKVREAGSSSPPPLSSSSSSSSSLALAFADPLRVNRKQGSWKWIKAQFGWQDAYRVPEGLRQVQEGGAVCSWAYAVTRRGAARVRSALARGGNQAFDIGLMDACDARAGGLRCLTVNPALVSTYSPPREAGYLSLVNVADGKEGRVADEAQFEGVKGATPFIFKSARCEALFAEECLPSY